MGRPEQIELELGAPADETRARVADATPSELERWVVDILTAESLGALLES